METRQVKRLLRASAIAGGILAATALGSRLLAVFVCRTAGAAEFYLKKNRDLGSERPFRKLDRNR